MTADRLGRVERQWSFASQRHRLQTQTQLNASAFQQAGPGLARDGNDTTHVWQAGQTRRTRGPQVNDRQAETAQRQAENPKALLVVAEQRRVAGPDLAK